VRLQIESTGELVEVAPGFLTRVWVGVDAQGAKCFVFVACIGTTDPVDSRFEAELLELAPKGRKADMVMAKLYETEGQ
jgi:hypothetical protein